MNTKYIFWFGCVFGLYLVAPSYAKRKDQCDIHYTNNTGDLSRFTIQPGQRCVWTIKPKDIGPGDLFLAFKEFRLADNDKVLIKKNLNSEILFQPFSGHLESFSLLTGEKELVVILETSETQTAFKRSLWGFYSGDARTVLLTVNKGVVRTPYYKQGVGRKTIKYRFKPVNMPSEKLSVSFEDYNIKHGSISIMNSENADGEYLEQPPDILAKVTVTVQVTIDLRHPNQSMIMILESVTADCSRAINMSKSADPYALTLEVPKLKDFNSPILPQLGIDCRWIVYSVPGMVLDAHIKSVKLNSNLDHLVINNGGRRESESLLQTTHTHATVESPQGKNYRTTSHFLWISFRKSSIKENADFQVLVTPIPNRFSDRPVSHSSGKNRRGYNRLSRDIRDQSNLRGELITLRQQQQQHSPSQKHGEHEKHE